MTPDVQENWEDLSDRLYDASFRPATGVSVAFDTLIDEVGWDNLFDETREDLDMLLDANAGLEPLAEELTDHLYAIPDLHWIAPFDGTIDEYLVDGENERDWVIREDLLPFLDRWRKVLLATKDAGRGA